MAITGEERGIDRGGYRMSNKPTLRALSIAKHVLFYLGWRGRDWPGPVFQGRSDKAPSFGRKVLTPPTYCAHMPCMRAIEYHKNNFELSRSARTGAASIRSHQLKAQEPPRVANSHPWGFFFSCGGRQRLPGLTGSDFWRYTAYISQFAFLFALRFQGQKLGGFLVGMETCRDGFGRP